MTRRDDEPNPWLVTAVVLMGLLATGINFTILAVSRPTIAADLGVDPTTLVWLISGPILANALVTTAAGKWSDRWGHRRAYLTSMTGVVVMTIASAFSPSASILIATRVAGAIAGAALGPSGLAFISMVFPPHRRGRALGYWSLVGAGGPVVGLIIGGPLVDSVGWRAVFWMQVPLLLVALVMTVKLLPVVAGHATGSFDVAGNIALGVGAVAVMLAAERVRVWGAFSVPFAICGMVAVCALVAFVFIERRSASPLVPLDYFRRRGFVAPNLALFFAQFGYMGGFILAPKLLSDVHDETQTRISQLLIPRPLAFAIAGVAAGYLVARVGARVIVLLGLCLVTVSLVMLGWQPDALSTALVLVAIALSGLGMGMAQPSFTTMIANSVRSADLGVAAATQQMIAQVATSLGMNVLDTVEASNVARLGVSDSYHLAYMVGAAITVVGVLPAVLMPKGGSPRRTP